MESKHVARFKGTVDLDEEAKQALKLDGMVFFVVGVHVEEMGATRVNRDGVAVSKDILNVTDARVMVGDIRQQAVMFLAGEVAEPPAIETASPSFESYDRYERVEEELQDGVVGSIHDYKRTSRREPRSDAGPRVEKFRPEEEDPSEEEEAGGDTVRTVAEAKPRKDKALARFMQEA